MDQDPIHHIQWIVPSLKRESLTHGSMTVDERNTGVLNVVTVVVGKTISLMVTPIGSSLFSNTRQSRSKRLNRKVKNSKQLCK